MAGLFSTSGRQASTVSYLSPSPSAEMLMCVGHQKPRQSKSGKMLALIDAFVRGFNLGANSSRRTSHSSAVSASNPTGTVAATISEADFHPTIPGSCISKQTSFESTSTYATSTGSSCPASVTEGSTFLEANIACVKPLSVHQSVESSSFSTVTSAHVEFVNSSATSDADVNSVACVAGSESFSNLFSSASSSSMLEETPSSAFGNDSAIVTRVLAIARSVNIVIPDRCPSAHGCTALESCDTPSSAESCHSTYQGSSSEDTSLIDLTPGDLADYGTIPVSSDLVSNVQTDSSPDAQTPNVPEAEIPAPVENRWDRIQSQVWMGLVSSGSSSSSLGDLALTVDDVAATNPIPNEPESCSSPPCGDPEIAEEECLPEPEYDYSQQLPSFGMAGHILMTHVFVPYTSYNTTYYAAPVLSTSCDSWSPTQLTVIIEEDEPDETFHHREEEDTTNLSRPNTVDNSGCPTSAVIFASKQGPAEPLVNKESAITEPFTHRDGHQTTSTARGETSLRQYKHIELECKDVQTIEAVAEDKQPSNGGLDASSSHDSSLAGDSDKFEYAQVCVPFRSAIAL